MAYKQAKSRRKIMQRTYDEIKHMRKHYTGAGVWFDEDRGFFYRYSPSSTPGYAKLLRRIGNKRVRQSKDTFKNSEYRKVFDYKWTLF